MVAVLLGSLPLAGLFGAATPHAFYRAAAPQDMPGHNATTGSRLDIKDEMGRPVSIPQPVRRIVSLAPSVTETLFALGLGDRVVGDTDFCDYPPEAKEKTRIGGPVDPNIEQIAALHPDLVIVSRSINRLASAQSLEHLGIAVYATDPHNVDDVLTSTQRLGELLGAGESGRSLVANLHERLDEIDRKIAGEPPKTALMVVWLDPLISVGPGTFMADALRRSGVHSVIDTAQPWPTISLEQVIRLQPSYLIFSSDDERQVQKQIAELQDRPGWRALDAVRNRRFIVVSEAISHPSPRLVDGIEQLARALYPSQFAARSGFRRDTAVINRVTYVPAYLFARLPQPIFSIPEAGRHL